MELITEDTPEGGVDELNWKIERLTETIKQKDQTIESLEQRMKKIKRMLDDSQECYLRLTNMLTVGVLRSAGVNVTVDLPESDEDYEDD